MVADAWNDVRKDDALGSASRVPTCGESLTGVQIESPKWLTSLRTTRIELPIWRRGCEHYRRCYSSKWYSTIDVLDGHAAGRGQP